MMFKKPVFICFMILFLLNVLKAQQQNPVSISYAGKEQHILSGQIVTLAFFIANNDKTTQTVQGIISAPERWKLIPGTQSVELKPSEKKLLLFTVQAPDNYSVGNYNLQLSAIRPETNDTLSVQTVLLTVKETESISLLFVKSPTLVKAGEIFRAEYLLKNIGNTRKKVFIETQNCDVEGPSEIEIEPGNSVQFHVYKQTSPALMNAQKEFFSVRATISGEVKKSIYRSFTVFPSKEGKKDFYFRFPVSVSATYLTSSVQDKLESGYQFEISGSGPLDPQGKQQLEFLARGPNNSNLSYLGLYDQYYISYTNRNLELFAGEKAFRFTPLTESSRFGFGSESKIRLNNGFRFGFTYVQPRFYNNIKSELGGFTGFEFNKENEINLFYISKTTKYTNDVAQLISLSGRFMPFKKTNVDVEFSRGLFQGIWDKAFRMNLNANFSIFQVAGNYYFAGKNYPGYFSNSTFYSGNVSARITQKINMGFYAREDFRNAELDTFFVTAPYTKTYQAILNYNIARRAYLKVYWREFERKDRLDLDKFHYKTSSFNTQFNHRFKQIEYSILSEIGKTTNLLLQTGQNTQNAFQGNLNVSYHVNSKNAIRVFGGWSNINSFVSNEQRNVTAGLSVISQIAKNLKANFNMQNAYDVDDYYRNRNLMQFNLDYNFLKRHIISARSFYTIFRQQTGNPEFTATVTYTYKLGVPLKQIIKAGVVRGRIIYDNDEPAGGIVLTLQNKTAVTNGNGEFLFTTVEPGRHLLLVDRSNFKINEVTNIPTPVDIEVFEDKESTINFRITTGAKFTGTLQIVKSGFDVLNSNEITAENVIVELKNEFEEFRITTGKEGKFAFPMVRPGNYVFKIYTNSLPTGHEIKQSVYNLDLKPGEEKILTVEMTSKKKNIIFKSPTTLTPMLNGKTKSITTAKNKLEQPIDSVFYSVQIGAFKRTLTRESGYFNSKPFDFELQMNNLHKYFVGKFATFEEAVEERQKLAHQFKNPFIVKIKNNTAVPEKLLDD